MANSEWLLMDKEIKENLNITLELDDKIISWTKNDKKFKDIKLNEEKQSKKIECLDVM